MSRWQERGENYGIVKELIEDPVLPTYARYEIWSIGSTGEPAEFMAEYRDRDMAASKMELMERFRETAREALTAG